MRVHQETENIWELRRLNLVNCFLVREADGFTLVDTNLPGSAARILDVVKNLSAPIRRIILTHAHFDHVGSLDELRGAIPDAEVYIGEREARLMAGDLRLEPGENGKGLNGFLRTETKPTKFLRAGERFGSLEPVPCPGHTPGQFALQDMRDGTLLAADAFVNHLGLTAAGAFKVHFPLAALFCWNKVQAAKSALALRKREPTRLLFGHGDGMASPLARMDAAVEFALRQCGKMLD